MTTKKYISLFLSVLITYILQAAPGTYYNSIDTNKSCANFKTILAQLISTNTTVLSYGIVDDNFNKTDLKPATGANTGWVVSDKYSSDNPGGIDFCNYRFPSDFVGLSPAQLLLNVHVIIKNIRSLKRGLAEKIYIPCILICTLFGHQMLL